MSRYRKRLPQLGQSVFLTDGELENTVSLQCGMDVPGLAAFTCCDMQRAAAHSMRILRGTPRWLARMA